MDGEVTMYTTAGPAVLGGVMMGVALVAWSLGRWQGGLGTGEDRDTLSAGDAGRSAMPPVLLAPSPASVDDRDSTRSARNVPIEAGISLGDMHAEISAYRRAEQVLAGMTLDPLQLIAEQRDGDSEGQNFGMLGEPACGLCEVPFVACACLDDFHPAPRPLRAAQPSLPLPSEATRV